MNPSKSSSKMKNKKIAGSSDERETIMDSPITALVPVENSKEPSNFVAPIVSCFNDRIRPLIDVVDKLRRLNIMKEGIQLPTIVVVGDQSSGKSSVLESLAGISLPRGQGICTRVPLIMRLQQHSAPKTELRLEFNGKSIVTDESHVSEAINVATEELAGHGKGISNTPLTLEVRKNGVPDLTMVDLPGITRVPVHGQPENIYDQIKDIIMEYITPEQSIILNVLSATVDFTTCESIRMSQVVDKTGERTLAVVTKADRAPEGLMEKVTADDVNIGLGYVCVRNRIGEESYEDARREEARIFESHQLLSKIDKSIVGIPVLAQKLVQIQATSIAKNLPDIVRSINEKLSENLSELNKLPKNLTSNAEAVTAFMRIISSAKETLRKILLRGEFDEYLDDKNMHCTARLVEMLNRYSEKLNQFSENDSGRNFLMEELSILEESKTIGLPNFLPRTAFLVLLQRKVKAVSSLPIGFVETIWNYLENVLTAVLTKHSSNYHQLQLSTKRAGHVLIAKMKKRSLERVMEFVEMEKLTDYTCNPEYGTERNKLISQQESFVKQVFGSSAPKIMIEGYGEVEVGELRQYEYLLPQAYDLRMTMTAYWKIVLKRLVDCMALHLEYSIEKLIDEELESEIVNELLGPGGVGMEKMLEEAPNLSLKRDKLNRSIGRLRESKKVVANALDRIATFVG
ncbi:dynamin-related protein 4C-like [Cucumis melo var. makuwa]|uniref:Dynamin-related protein 4C-like n=2 Tax=Cucumis melo TaxID=3656 RepID=A0A5A7UPN5_CUCMM|nr:dynamin-related protein 4C-like [Cucumis melo var. makuwa]